MRRAPGWSQLLFVKSRVTPNLTSEALLRDGISCDKLSPETDDNSYRPTCGRVLAALSTVTGSAFTCPWISARTSSSNLSHHRAFAPTHYCCFLLLVMVFRNRIVSVPSYRFVYDFFCGRAGPPQQGCRGLVFGV